MPRPIHCQRSKLQSPASASSCEKKSRAPPCGGFCPTVDLTLRSRLGQLRDVVREDGCLAPFNISKPGAWDCSLEQAQAFRPCLAAVLPPRILTVDEQATVESEVQQVETAEQELVEGEEHVVQEEPQGEEYDLI
ncbi:uncharacterized protein [Zea mays]|uniref:uncharacterized protein n=1 Tax=Zea mays TaxID=4577 RepID=UPI0004DEB3C2|nr:uncharacterized protein LOC103638366 [Zea mays]|eukprot:XP_008659520.1 uncharacterized protein LOC103638366 [Zea mays]